MKVYIVVYSDYDMEEWNVEAVFLEKKNAKKYVQMEKAEKGKTVEIEEWDTED